jgi:hypothetical protein
MSAAKQFALTELSNDELDARAAAAVTSYGVGTHSYNHSTEKREMDRQREAITAKYESGPHQIFLAPLLCRCPQRDYPHELSVHSLIRYEWWKRELRTLWPWSLMASVREEPSTERSAA